MVTFLIEPGFMASLLSPLTHSPEVLSARSATGSGVTGINCASQIQEHIDGPNSLTKVPLDFSQRCDQQVAERMSF